ncbi:MAG: KilA-N domain-containing protein [Rikenellaceae bacterium]
MENLKIFEYNDNPISFITNDDGEPMINATEMAKACGKNIKHWFENQYTVDYIKSYVELKKIKVIGGIPLSTFSTTTLSRRYPSLISVVRGNFSDNRKQGTFLCRGLSIEFARWLNPAFAIWCDERIMEYLQLGFTASDAVLTQMQEDPNFANQMAEALKAEREKNKALEEHNHKLIAEAEENAPKVNFFDNVTNLESAYNKRKTLLISKVAKNFKMSAPALNKFLIRKGVIVRVDGGYDIGPKYAGENIAWQNVKEKPEYNEDGELVYPGRIYLEYYPKGVEIIKELLSEAGLIKTSNVQPNT